MAEELKKYGSVWTSMDDRERDARWLRHRFAAYPEMPPDAKMRIPGASEWFGVGQVEALFRIMLSERDG